MSCSSSLCSSLRWPPVWPPRRPGSDWPAWGHCRSSLILGDDRDSWSCAVGTISAHLGKRKKWEMIVTLHILALPLPSLLWALLVAGTGRAGYTGCALVSDPSGELGVVGGEVAARVGSEYDPSTSRGAEGKAISCNEGTVSLSSTMLHCTGTARDSLDCSDVMELWLATKVWGRLFLIVCASTCSTLVGFSKILLANNQIWMPSLERVAVRVVLRRSYETHKQLASKLVTPRYCWSSRYFSYLLQGLLSPLQCRLDLRQRILQAGDFVFKGFLLSLVGHLVFAQFVLEQSCLNGRSNIRMCTSQSYAQNCRCVHEQGSRVYIYVLTCRVLICWATASWIILFFLLRSSSSSFLRRTSSSLQ